MASGRDWPRVFVSQAVPLEDSVTVSAASCCRERGLGASWKKRTSLVTVAILQFFLSLLLSLRKEGGSLFWPSINSHLGDEGSQSPPLAWASCWSPDCLSKSLLDVSLERPYWRLKLSLSQTKFRFLSPILPCFALLLVHEPIHQVLWWFPSPAG